MKTCPECAESVQDAARKCRYCGYRFEEGPAEPAPATTSANQSDAKPASPATSVGPVAATRTNRPFLLVAAGGALIAVGGILMAIATAGDVGFIGYAIDWFVFGGVALALGWGILLVRGATGLIPLIGSLVLTACWIAIAVFLSQDQDDLTLMLAAMLGNFGLAACAFAHLDALELEGMEGPRVVATIAAAGFVIATVASYRQLPDIVHTIGVWIGTIGTVAFGAALAVSATKRGVEAA